MPLHSPPPKFSVIVPAHNAESTITFCINALQQQTNVPDEYEIIIVNDGSTDSTAALAQARGVRVISQQKKGPANARNVGIRTARGSIVCFTDADCQPTPTWLSQIVAPLLASPEVAGCKGAYCCRQKELFARFVQIEYEDKYDVLENHQYITFMDFYSAAYRRQILLDMDGFDEQFTAANSEDRELSYRLAECGHKMVFQRSALVCHFHSDSFGKYALKKIYNGYWTSLAVRHHPARMKNDTYTPQMQKVQIALMGLLLIMATAGSFLPPLLAVAGVIAVIFFLTTLPFAVKAWRKDKMIAIVSPLILALRAITLGIGFAWGWIRLFTGNQFTAQAKIQ